MDTNIVDQLKLLGFGDYEAKIYLTLLENSPASATLIGRKCNLARSSVYTTLASLIAKGIVSTTNHNNVKQFVAEDPSVLDAMLKKEKDILENKTKVLGSLSSVLMKTMTPLMHTPNTVFFEGQDGLKRIYLSMLRDANKEGTMYILRDEFVWTKDWQFIFAQEWHNRVRRLKIEKNIKTYLIVNDSKIEREKAKFYGSRKYTTISYLPKKRTLKDFAIYILDDVVSIMSMENNNLVGIKITNKSLAENFKIILSLL
jgi:sugar-specific transcriptional regulator TrmB